MPVCRSGRSFLQRRMGLPLRVGCACALQVVDARDPLLYRCEDLEAYGRELCATKTPLLLLNKADLLPVGAGGWAVEMRMLPCCRCPVKGSGKGCAAQHAIVGGMSDVEAGTGGA